MNPGAAEAARVLDAGGVVAYPTDTLYGLGARVDRIDAVRRVFDIKRRPLDQPLSIAVAAVEDIDRYALVTPAARRLFPLLPGGLTLILDRRDSVPDLVTAGGASVGVRVPDHPDALAVLARTGALTATSANLHGQPDPLTLEETRRQLGNRVDYYLASTSPPVGVASTLVDVRGDAPRVLRPGVVTDAQVRQYFPH